MVKRKKIRSKLCVVLLLFSITSFAQKKGNTLLWKITGNGLTKPSYLYGTIHLKNSKVFDFSDSVLVKLHECDAFSAELKMDSVFYHMMQSAFDNKDSESGENPFGTFGLEQDNPLFKQQGELAKVEDDGATYESTFLDPWLEAKAAKWGKNIYGLEDIEDQLFILKDFGKYATDSTKNTGKELKKILKYYLDQDLKAIEKSFLKQAKKDPEGVERLLYSRNVTMANKIEEITKKESLFAAIGAAHLPGEKGVIDLLQKKGFTVTPVYSEKRGLHKKLNYPESTLPTYAVTSEITSSVFQFPGPIVNMSSMLPNTGSKMEMMMGADMYNMGMFINLNVKMPNLEGQEINEETIQILAMTFAKMFKASADDLTKIKIADQPVYVAKSTGNTAGMGKMSLYFFAREGVFTMLILSVGNQEVEDEYKNKIIKSLEFNKE